MPVAALLGGAIATPFGLRGPWLAASALMAVALLPAVGVVTGSSIQHARRSATGSDQNGR